MTRMEGALREVKMDLEEQPCEISPIGETHKSCGWCFRRPDVMLASLERMGEASL